MPSSGSYRHTPASGERPSSCPDPEGSRGGPRSYPPLASRAPFGPEGYWGRAGRCARPGRFGSRMMAAVLDFGPSDHEATNGVPPSRRGGLHARHRGCRWRTTRLLPSADRTLLRPRDHQPKWYWSPAELVDRPVRRLHRPFAPSWLPWRSLRCCRSDYTISVSQNGFVQPPAAREARWAGGRSSPTFPCVPRSWRGWSSRSWRISGN